MNEPKEALSGNWMSTYSVITCERILERYGVRLGVQDLLQVIHNPDSIYYRLLQVPLRHVMNGIVLQQALDYLTYVQKLFVDYLLSGETAKPAEAQGALVREDLETERQAVLFKSDAFRQIELDNDRLILDSQAAILQYTQCLNEALNRVVKDSTQTLFEQQGDKIHEKTLHRALTALLVDAKIDGNLHHPEKTWARVDTILHQSLSSAQQDKLLGMAKEILQRNEKFEKLLAHYRDAVESMRDKVKQYRTDFHAHIISSNTLLDLLPDYRADRMDTEKNQEDLYFDAEIGL